MRRLHCPEQWFFEKEQLSFGEEMTIFSLDLRNNSSFFFSDLLSQAGIPPFFLRFSFEPPLGRVSSQTTIEKAALYRAAFFVNQK